MEIGSGVTYQAFVDEFCEMNSQQSSNRFQGTRSSYENPQLGRILKQQDHR